MSNLSGGLAAICIAVAGLAAVAVVWSDERCARRRAAAAEPEPVGPGYCPTCSNTDGNPHMFWCDRGAGEIAALAPWEHDDQLHPGERAAAIDHLNAGWHMPAADRDEVQP